MGHTPISSISKSSSSLSKSSKSKHVNNGTTAREYQAKLSFAPLLQYWERQLGEGSAPAKLIAKEVIARAKRLPEFSQPIDDPTWLAKHTELLELMLSPVFPATSNADLIGLAYPPCSSTAFYHTPAWQPAFDVVLPRLDDQTELPFEARVRRVVSRALCSEQT